MLFGGLTAGLTTGLGGPLALSFGKVLGETAGRMLAYGLIGGLTSKISGGNFASGFLAAGIGSLAGGFSGPDFNPAKMIASAALGGAASVLGGGKFADGAITGAFAYAATSLSEDAPAAPPGNGSSTSAQGAIASLPPDVQQTLDQAGVTIRYVENSVTEALPQLAGVAAPGWENSGTCATYDCVPGTFWAPTRQVIIATSGMYSNSSFDFVLHEIGHAYDFALGYASSSSAFSHVYAAEKSSMGAYYNQACCGAREMFAEGFANYYGGNAAFDAAHPALTQYFGSTGH